MTTLEPDQLRNSLDVSVVHPDVARLSRGALDLSLVPEVLHQQAIDALSSGDAMAFVMSAETSGNALALIFDNFGPLMRRGIYEQALIDAFVSTNTNSWNWSIKTLKWMLDLCDRRKLRSAGDPLPRGDAFTAYRGVSGRGKSRKVRGISWTLSKEKAVWFATRFPDLEDPGVYETVIDPRDVYCFLADREEAEFLYIANRYRRVWHSQ